MAYGVKYRLEFSDVLGNGKKVEILQDGYTGDVLPMIGTGNPVKITWDEDDDFYEPIIGSSCTLNLMVTDDVQYDNFWEADEFEYKVIIYYAEKKVDEFVNRVEQFATSGNGRIEVPECIESNFSQEITISTEFRQRVQEDGGIVDKLSCIGEVITDSVLKNYEVFWQGFLYVDGFQESFGSKPFPLTLKALDGLGTLNAYDPPIIGTNAPQASGVYIYIPFTRGEYDHTMQILNNLNLEMDLYWQGEDQWNTSTNLPKRYWVDGVNLDEDYNIYNSKEILNKILRQSNSRIFQAFGRWYVVKNSTYLDSVFKDQYYDRSVFQTALSNGQNEIIDFQVFRWESYTSGITYDATVYKGKSDHNVTRQIKSDLQPLNNDMVAEYLPPLKKVMINTDLETLNKYKRIHFLSPSFEWGNTDYSIPYGSVDTHDVISNGNKSYKLTNYVTSTGTKTKAIDLGGNTSYGLLYTVRNGPIKAGFKYYFESTNTSPNYKLYYVFKLWGTPSAGGGTYTATYWDNEDQTALNSSIVYNEIEINDAQYLNSWQEFELNIPDDISILKQNGKLELEIYFPYISSSTGYSAMYIDNVIIYQDRGFQKGILLDADLGKNSGVYDYELLPNESWRFYVGGELGDLQNNAQEILNDYRSFVPRYEGTFYNNNSKPITPLAKPYINFGDEFKGKQAEMIDGMTYNVKANEYSLIMHTSNNDPDESVTFINKT